MFKILLSNKITLELIANLVVYNNREVNVIDGDETDLRFLDMQNSIVALKAKGKAIKDNSGFVIRSIEEI